jgi:hypothetical protein
MIHAPQITVDEAPKTPPSRSVPSGPDSTGELNRSIRFYAAHLSRESSEGHIPPDSEVAPADEHVETLDREAMLDAAAHILASSHFHGYDARYMNNPRLVHLMDSGRFETTEIRKRALKLGLLRQESPHYPEQVPDTAATTEPIFRQLREWLKGMGHGSH